MVLAARSPPMMSCSITSARSAVRQRGRRPLMVRARARRTRAGAPCSSRWGTACRLGRGLEGCCPPEGRVVMMVSGCWGSGLVMVGSHRDDHTAQLRTAGLAQLASYEAGARAVPGSADTDGLGDPGGRQSQVDEPVTDGLGASF